MNLKIILLLTLSVFPVLAEDSIMYRWRDNNNQLHVGFVPPKDLPYETISIANNRRVGKAEIDAAKDPQLAELLANLTPEEKRTNCDKARNNLQLLAQDEPLYEKNSDGTTQLLTKEEIIKHRKLAEQPISLVFNKN